ncbi:MAG: hypothetical protein CM15mP120_03910 [Pseudomonadota bacterium]|nr:MAG: hypothetical protein CM15mP120_03910 [Pseudomonadota bacterium]
MGLFLRLSLCGRGHSQRGSAARCVFLVTLSAPNWLPAAARGVLTIWWIVPTLEALAVAEFCFPMARVAG